MPEMPPHHTNCRCTITGNLETFQPGDYVRYNGHVAVITQTRMNQNGEHVITIQGDDLFGSGPGEMGVACTLLESVADPIPGSIRAEVESLQTRIREAEAALASGAGSQSRAALEAEAASLVERMRRVMLPHQEFGTEQRQPRPFMRPAVESVTGRHFETIIADDPLAPVSEDAMAETARWASRRIAEELDERLLTGDGSGEALPPVEEVEVEGSRVRIRRLTEEVRERILSAVNVPRRMLMGETTEERVTRERTAAAREIMGYAVEPPPATTGSEQWSADGNDPLTFADIERWAEQQRIDGERIHVESDQGFNEDRVTISAVHRGMRSSQTVSAFEIARARNPLMLLRIAGEVAVRGLHDMVDRMREMERLNDSFRDVARTLGRIGPSAEEAAASLRGLSQAMGIGAEEFRVQYTNQPAMSYAPGAITHLTVADHGEPEIHPAFPHYIDDDFEFAEERSW